MAFAMEDNGRWSKRTPITTHTRKVVLIRLKPSQKAGAQHYYCNAICSFVRIFVGQEHDRVNDMLPGPSVTVEGG
ncbi:hypothetical protein HYFRA_00013722 [Hymenoscyphus fraxineus]|uniref:Uncharacterized protein n=1 Tax=Hymenoscyphus fraxineus TaxID=746836 RepID=A0A9N9Q1N2_9HELO|nr:hypothetical protein HYFRA_00013722 [Hymenoscyphus fraxineus]